MVKPTSRAPRAQAMWRPGAPGVAVVAAVALGATACSHSGGNAGQTSPGNTNAIKVTMANNGGKDSCALSAGSVSAGPGNFTVANTSAPGISELELLRDQRIVGGEA